MSNGSGVRWLVVCIVLLCGTIVQGGSYQELIAEAKSRIVSTQDCVFNRDIEITLKKGQAVQLRCAANEHQITDFLLYYYEASIAGKTEGIIRADAFFADGKTSGGGSRISLDGALRQAAYTRCLVITRWHAEGDALHVEFRASDDLKYNQDIYRQWKSQGRRISTMLQSPEFTPPVPILEAERLAGFARLWSEVKYNFVFFDHVPEIDWDGILLEYIPRVQAARTDVEYYNVLRQCMALLRDGHTNIWGPSDEPASEPPIRVQAVQNEAVVCQVCSAEKMGTEELRKEWQAAGVRVGDVITHIDGRPVRQVLAETIYPYIAASTPHARDLAAYHKLLRGQHGTRVVLDVIRLDGSKTQATLTRGSYQFNRPPNEFQCRQVSDGIVYVNLPSFGSDQVVREFDGVFDQIRQARGLILDVRRNGGGSTQNGYAILSRLVDKSVPGSRWKSRKHIAAYKAWGRDEQWEEGTHGTIEPHATNHYGGPVVVLTGPETASAAEDFAVAFHASGRGKVVGQRTFGSTGQPLMVQLPGGGGARICTKRDTYPDGREFVGIGVIPDVEIEPSRQDIASQRDVILEKGIEEVRNLIKNTPAAR
jgi:carboxyl-terminal processing protease